MKWLILLKLFLLSSCANVYLPNSHNIPLHKEKDELKIGTDLSLSGIDFQLSYSLTDNIAIMANSNFRSSSGMQSNYIRYLYVEGGLGNYHRLGEYGVFETYIGGGVGSSHVDGIFAFLFNEIRYNAKGKYYRIFGQLNIGFEADLGAIAFGLRPAFVQYYKFESNRSNAINPNQLFIEPLFLYRVGWKFFKLENQIGVSIPSYLPMEFEHLPVIISFGIRLNITEMIESFSVNN